jgi:CelD/BcsL family acetyltransferase involved in cellulose biosynthesis
MNASSSAMIDRLAPEWDELAVRVGSVPYVRPGWVAAWWRAFGAGDLEIRTLRRDGRLAAVLPVARQRDVLRSVTNIHTPSSGLLAEDGGAATELARTLFTDNARRVSLESLDPSGDSMDACERAAREMGYRFVVRPFQRSPYLEITGAWSAYESRLSASLLADIRRSRRRLELLGSVRVDARDGHERLEESLAEMFAVEASGWKGELQTAIQSRADTAAFYTDVARWAAAHGMLRLFFLRLGQRPIAAFYALVARGTCHLLKGGYDPDFRRYSPGKVLMHEVLARAFAERLARVEFHGDADAYKLFWAGAVHEQKRFEAFSASLLGQLAWATLAYGRPFAKRLLGRPGDALT